MSESLCRIEEVDEVKNVLAVSSDTQTTNTPIPQYLKDLLIDEYIRPEVVKFHRKSPPLSDCIISSAQRWDWEEPPLFDSIPRGVVLDVNFLERLKDEEKKRTQPQ